MFQLQVIFYYLIQHNNALVIKNHINNDLSNLLITANSDTEKLAKISTINDLLVSMDLYRLENHLHQLKELLND
ncbi:MAG: hypothetical protein COB62_06175 [Piscirickettsiaceae bacterium]|nr:MAG: hypothetical protein COB62_06175 [Piscirickettsiaceae bacterium]